MTWDASGSNVSANLGATLRLLGVPDRDAIAVTPASDCSAEFVSNDAGLNFVEEAGFALILCMRG